MSYFVAYGFMYGMNSLTGRSLSGIDHLRQSVSDILTTPIGSRIMRREYGSRLFSLIDAPTSDANKLEIIAATAEAIMTWEDRIEVEAVSISTTEPGVVLVDLVGIYLPDGSEITLDGILVS